MSGRHRRIVASLLAAMALPPVGAMADQRSGTLRVTVEVVAQCSVASGPDAILHQTCTTAGAKGLMIARPHLGGDVGHTPPAFEPMQRQHVGGLLTVIY